MRSPSISPSPNLAPATAVRREPRPDAARRTEHVCTVFEDDTLAADGRRRNEEVASHAVEWMESVRKVAGRNEGEGGEAREGRQMEPTLQRRVRSDRRRRRAAVQSGHASCQGKQSRGSIEAFDHEDARRRRGGQHSQSLLASEAGARSGSSTIRRAKADTQ
jgi:hypothetical protein